MTNPQHESPRGYGNIYTPHAGAMIIQVQREQSLASRTIIVGPRQVKVLRFLNSRRGLAVAAFFVLSWLGLAVLAMRVPVLSHRVTVLERENQRIDTLAVALRKLHRRYDQVQKMLGAAGVPLPTAQPAQAAAQGPGAQPAQPVQQAQPVQPVPQPAAAASAPPPAGADSVTPGAAQ